MKLADKTLRKIADLYQEYETQVDPAQTLLKQDWDHLSLTWAGSPLQEWSDPRLKGLVRILWEDNTGALLKQYEGQPTWHFVTKILSSLPLEPEDAYRVRADVPCPNITPFLNLHDTAKVMCHHSTTVSAYQSPDDDTLIVEVDTPEVPENEKGPIMRIYLNDGPIYENPPYPTPGDKPIIKKGVRVMVADWGPGVVKAVTRDWVVVQPDCNSKEEAFYRGGTLIWIPSELEIGGGDESYEVPEGKPEE